MTLPTLSRLTFLSIGAPALMLASPAVASEKGWDDAGTIARNALVIAALGVPAVQEDWDGVLQAGGSIAAASVVTYGLKEAIPSRRPDGSDDKSFPSGHTSTSFAAAATLHKRHGWKVGVPAQLVAAFVGVSRVEANRHRWGDVAVGMVIGQASGFLITDRVNPNVQLTPWADTKGGGVAFAMRF